MGKLPEPHGRRLIAGHVILALAPVLAYSVVATQSLEAQNYAVLYSFPGVPGDGGVPIAGLIKDKTGNLYSTTWAGGTLGDGTVFKFSGRGNETVLYSFQGGGDGAFPTAGLVEDAGGNLYGTTTIGGAFYGTVFKLDTKGNETVLYSFTGFGDGGNPQAGLVLDAAGDLYGTTLSGGASGFGTVFSVDMSGHETVLHSFAATGGDGAFPYADLVEDAAGNLYGTTFGGGVYGNGTVFKVATNGDSTTLYSFTGGADGSGPVASLIRDGSGNLYGTTSRGGDQSVMCDGYVGCGTVFELTASGTEKVLYSFAGGADGSNPQAGLIRKGGSLYGTAPIGGASNSGTLFKVKAPETEDAGGDDELVSELP